MVKMNRTNDSSEIQRLRINYFSTAGYIYSTTGDKQLSKETADLEVSLNNLPSLPRVVATEGNRIEKMWFRASILKARTYSCYSKVLFVFVFQVN